jgi:sugar fermentation stimulation protein A
VEHARRDRGAYLILARLNEARSTGVGSLGLRNFPAGWYLYIGSARKGLTARTARHLRRGRKRKHWHMDYFVDCADELRSFPIRSGEDLECELAARFSALADDTVARFGAGDCSCPSHMAYYRSNPLHSARFIETLMEFRHGRIGGVEGERKGDEGDQGEATRGRPRSP